MMRATIRRCPGPESIRGREALDGSSLEGGRSSVAGILASLHHSYFLHFYLLISFF